MATGHSIAAPTRGRAAAAVLAASRAYAAQTSSSSSSPSSDTYAVLGAEATRLAAAAAGCALCAVARGLRGPRGRALMVARGAGSGGVDEFAPLVSTSAGPLIGQQAERILRGLGVPRSPAARLLMEIAQRQCAACGDGGLLTLCVAGHLLWRARGGDVDHGGAIAPRAAAEGFHVALSWATEYLFLPECPCAARLSWGDTSGPVALVRTVLRAKPVACDFLAGPAVDAVARAVLEAFLASLDQDSDTAPLAPFVRVACVQRSVGKAASVEPDAILIDKEARGGLPEGFGAGRAAAGGSLRVLVYEVSLRMPPPPEGTSVHVGEVFAAGGDAADGSAWSATAVEAAALQAAGAAIVAAGVHVVLSQKLIHPFLQRYLRKRGVLAIERLSIRHIDAAVKCTGAAALGAFIGEPIREEAMGALGEVWCAPDCGRDARGAGVAVGEGGGDTGELDRSRWHVWLRAAAPDTTPAPALRRRRRVATLVLSRGGESALDELKSACDAALRVLRGALVDPAVLAGAGCWETRVAAHVRARARAELEAGGARAAAELFADAVEAASAPVAGARELHWTELDVLEALRSGNAGARLRGFDASVGEGFSGAAVEAMRVSGTGECLEGRFVDLRGTVVNALRVAVEAASALMMVRRVCARV